MTDATKPELYPQYCFHLSPTINRWCHFRIADIWALRSHPGFQGQDVYFHLNHPIKWVRICGVVVAVDERETRHFYTIDDGSGATLECVVNVPPRTTAPGTSSAGATATATTTATNTKSNPSPNATATPPALDSPVDVGHVLDIKGSVGMFRENKQIRAEKVVHLRSTEQEVVFWEKSALLKRDVLSKPWVLDPREVRRCRKEDEGRSSSSSRRHHRGTGDRRDRKREKVTGLEKKALRETGLEHLSVGRSRSERTGLEKTGLEKTGLEKTGLEKIGLKTREQEKAAMQKTARSHRTGLERTGQERREQAMTTMEKTVRSYKTGLERIGLERASASRESKPLAGQPVRATGLEKRRAAKPVTRLIPVTGNYDALGL